MRLDRVDTSDEVDHVHGLSLARPDLVPATEDGQRRGHLEPVRLGSGEADRPARVPAAHLDRPVEETGESVVHAEIRALGFRRRYSETKSSRTSDGTLPIWDWSISTRRSIVISSSGR